MFKHNPDLKHAGHLPPKFSSVGENIWTGYPTTLLNATRAIQSWVDEERDYDYNSNACNNVCGHYKQVHAACALCIINEPMSIYAPFKQNVEFCFYFSLGCLGTDEQSWLCCPLVPEWSSRNYIC